MSNIQIQVAILALSAALVAVAILCLAAYIGSVVKSHVAASALKFLTTTAGTLVMAAMEDVRNLKDPLKPGTWTSVEAGRIKGRVLTELHALGGHAIEELQSLRDVSGTSIETLLDSLIEEQVEVLRQGRNITPPTTINVSSSLSPAPSPALSSAPVPDPAKS